MFRLGDLEGQRIVVGTEDGSYLRRALTAADLIKNFIFQRLIENDDDVEAVLDAMSDQMRMFHCTGGGDDPKDELEVFSNRGASDDGLDRRRQF